LLIAETAAVVCYKNCHLFLKQKPSIDISQVQSGVL